MPIPHFLLFALLVLASSPTEAQEALRDLHSPDSFVRSAAVAGDTLYVAGDFITVGPPTGRAAALNRTTGEVDLAQTRIGGRQVEVVLPDGRGGWYVGGETEWAGGEPRRNLAHILADGSLDPDFAPDPQATGSPFFFGTIDGLALSEDSTVLYVGGRFDTVGGEPREDLAALDAATGDVLPLSVDFERTGNSNGVSDLLHKDGVLYLGGDFTSVDGVTRIGAAALDAADRDAPGTLLPWDLRLTGSSTVGAFGFGVGPPPTDTTLYVGGIFDAVRGKPRPSGSAEVTLADSATGEGGEPTDWTTGFQLGGGPITVAEDVIWTPSGAAIPLFTIDRATGESTGHPVGPGLRSGRALAFDSTGGPEGQGVVYLAAARDFPGDPFPSQYLVAIDAETKRPLPGYFDDDALLGGGTLRVAKGRSDRGITSLAVRPEGRLYVGGSGFYGIGGEPRRFLAGIDLTTGRATPFNEDFVIFSSVEEVTVSPDERFLYFLTFNGLGVADLATGILSDFPGGARFAAQARRAHADSPAGLVRRAGPVVARADGSPAPPFAALPRPADPAPGDTSRGDTSRVRSNSAGLLASDDRLYLHTPGAAVAFDRFSGETLWVTLTESFPANPQAEELLLVEAGPPGAEGDTLFLAGPINAAGGEEREKFAALDAATGTVLAWNVNPVEEPNGAGQALAALGSRLYLGGSRLSAVGGEPREDAAAVVRATGEVLAWDPQEEGLAVFGLAAQPGPGGGTEEGVVYLVGSFDGIGGTEQRLAAAVDAETAALLAWDPQPTGGAVYNVVVAEAQQRVVLTGTFTNGLRGSGHAFVTALTPARPFQTVAAEDEAAVPGRAALSAAHPNPFRGAASLTLSLPSSQRVEVTLFDVLGRRVAVLHDGPLTSGSHALTLDGSGLPSGVYVVRAVGERFTASRRVTVVR